MYVFTRYLIILTLVFPQIAMASDADDLIKKFHKALVFKDLTGLKKTTTDSFYKKLSKKSVLMPLADQVQSEKSQARFKVIKSKIVKDKVLALIELPHQTFYFSILKVNEKLLVDELYMDD